MKGKVQKVKWLKDAVAYRYLYEECGDVVISYNDSADKLPDLLIIEPGNYQVFGINYSLDKNGLYRFINSFKNFEQRIVWNGSMDKEGIDDLISSLSWIIVHGYADDKLPFKKKYKKSLHYRLIMSCSQTVTWISKILEKENIKSREVATLTLDKWNSYDNGHSMMEVYIENIHKWVVYDVDNHVMFSLDSHFLNICELCDAIRNGKKYQLHHLAKTILCDVSTVFSYYCERIFSNEAEWRKWYGRVLQVPLIRSNDGNVYFFDKINRNRIESYLYSYKYMEKQLFMNHFY